MESGVCDDLGMHTVPPSLLSRHMLEGERVCEALSGLGESGDIAEWASLFRTLGDPTRLRLLICIYHAGPISVTDLALAAGLNETTASQALRLLRASGVVTAHRSGRLIRYELASDDVGQLIDRVAGPRKSSVH